MRLIMVDKATSDEERSRTVTLGELPFDQQWELVLRMLEAASAALDPVRKPNPELYRLYWTTFSTLLALYSSAENWPQVGAAPRYWIPKECAEALQTKVSDLGRGIIIPEIQLVRNKRGRPRSGGKSDEAKILACVYYELAKQRKIPSKNIASEIAAHFGVEKETIYGWRKEAQDNGALQLALQKISDLGKFRKYYNEISKWYKRENLKS
jgi:hypothetical protein